jgi:hypothetical protein
LGPENSVIGLGEQNHLEILLTRDSIIPDISIEKFIRRGSDETGNGVGYHGRFVYGEIQCLKRVSPEPAVFNDANKMLVGLNSRMLFLFAITKHAIVESFKLGFLPFRRLSFPAYHPKKEGCCYHPLNRESYYRQAQLEKGCSHVLQNLILVEYNDRIFVYKWGLQVEKCKYFKISTEGEVLDVEWY